MSAIPSPVPKPNGLCAALEHDCWTHHPAASARRPRGVDATASRDGVASERLCVILALPVAVNVGERGGAVLADVADQVVCNFNELRLRHGPHVAVVAYSAVFLADEKVHEPVVAYVG